jgi:cell division protein ZapD
VNKKVVYEHPLNEKIRNWLRLEHLFAKVAHNIKNLSEWDSRAAIDSLLQILEFTSRNNIKTELLKNLEYHIQIMQHWQQFPNVNKTRIEQLLAKLNVALADILKLNNKSILQQNKIINSIKQRHNIIGGTCAFDLPSYHYWLNKLPRYRQVNLTEWLNSFNALRNALELNLYIIRNNSMISYQTAVNGIYNIKLTNDVDYQLIRILLTNDSVFYPEISRGRQKIIVRFFEYDETFSLKNNAQTEQDVNFELFCCTD